MGDEIYHKVAKILDTLPNGFPSTESGIEIAILKKIFSEQDGELFCDLKLSFETSEAIAKRTGRPLEGLEERLMEMWRLGQILGVDVGDVKIFRMMPWAFGIYEFQLNHMDREFAEMCEEYFNDFGKQFLMDKPQLMQVVPIEKEISAIQETLPYEKVSSIIESGASFGLGECICKKEKRLVGEGCDKPTEVCMGIAPIPGVFEKNNYWGRAISKEKAKEVLNMAEEAGLVHLTNNIESGHYYICNCCGCCCGILRGINKFGVKDSVNSHFFAEIDPEECVACGVCADERCQVNAIEEDGDVYRVIKEQCIGCGLCISTCPSDAIHLERKSDDDMVMPPVDEKAWFQQRGDNRGVDFSAYK